MDMGDAPRSQLGMTSLNGLTIARMVINWTWQADALANDFELCLIGVAVVSEAAEVAGVASMPDLTNFGGPWYYHDGRHVPRVGPEIAATPIFGALGHMFHADVRSSRAIRNEQTPVLLGECAGNDFDLGVYVRTLYWLP